MPGAACRWNSSGTACEHQPLIAKQNAKKTTCEKSSCCAGGTVLLVFGAKFTALVTGQMLFCYLTQCHGSRPKSFDLASLALEPMQRRSRVSFLQFSKPAQWVKQGPLRHPTSGNGVCDMSGYEREALREGLDPQSRWIAAFPTLESLGEQEPVEPATVWKTTASSMHLLGKHLLERQSEVPDDIWLSTELENTANRMVSAMESGTPGASLSFSTDEKRVSVVNASALTPEIFEAAVRDSKAMLIRGALKAAHLKLSAFSDEELLANHGDSSLKATRIDPEYGVGPLWQDTMRLKDFVQRQDDPRRARWYARRMPLMCNFPDLNFRGLQLPAFMDPTKYNFSGLNPPWDYPNSEEGVADQENFPYTWMMYWGRGIGAYGLHYDDADNFYSVVEGVKFMRLFTRQDIDKKLVPGMRPFPQQNASTERPGRADIDEPIFNKLMRPPQYTHSQNIGAKPVDVVIGAGDALLLPRGWGHYTMSASPGSHKALAFWFYPLQYNQA